MATAGIDVGSLYTKVVIVDGGESVSSFILPTGDDTALAAEKGLEVALERAEINREDIVYIIATGQGRKIVKIADEVKSDIISHAKGTSHQFQSARTVVDIGAESSRAMKLTHKGKVDDFATNDKCASGTGMFLDVIARLMEIDVDDLGKLSLMAERAEEITSMCTVFAESEVISAIHRRIPREEIIAGIHESIAKRVYGMIGRVGVEEDVVLSGGVALNQGMVSALSKIIGCDLFVAENPQITGALGAALIAAEKGGK